MTARERSIAAILQDIIGDIQDIVQSEIGLAKSEIITEADKARNAAPSLILGALCLLLAALFLAWAMVYSLALVMPIWAAALILATLLASAGGIVLTTGVKKLQQVSAPMRTIASIKENVQWAKQQVK